MSFTVAIDGPAASGKGTLARAVARHFGFEHLDTGLLYRAVGARYLEGVDPVTAARELRASELDAERLRIPDIAQAASVVAAIPEVRAQLLAFQRAFAAREGGAVLDGRDIGTVICPDAAVKIYVTARDDIRAARRWRELRQKGHEIALMEVLEDLQTRDRRDQDRATSPLSKADDAILLDTTELSIDRATSDICDIVRKLLQS